MAHTIIKLWGGVLGPDVLRVRCDLARAESPVEVDYGTGDGWGPSPFQCADVRHTAHELAALGQRLAFEAEQVPQAGNSRLKPRWRVVSEEREFVARCKPWKSEGVRENKILVDSDGDVRVWDEIAGHYSFCHSLSPAQIRRLRRIARSSF